MADAPRRPARRRKAASTSHDIDGSSPPKTKWENSAKQSPTVPDEKSQPASEFPAAGPDPDWQQMAAEDFSAADDSTGDDGCFDELGLGELTEIQPDAEPDPSTLPPVKKQFIKKPGKKALPDEPAEAAGSAKPKKTRKPLNLDSLPKPSPGRWLVYALFFMTLIPLGVSVLMADDQNIEERIDQSLEQAEASGEQSEQDIAAGEPVGIDELILALPGHRVIGAFLARDTWMHWVFAAVSGIGFMTLFLALFRRFHEALGGAVSGARCRGRCSQPALALCCCSDFSGPPWPHRVSGSGDVASLFCSFIS